MVNPIGLKTKTKKRQPTSERQPDSVTVSVQKTLQVVQFEPVVVSVSETYTLQEGDDVAEVRTEMYNRCAKAVVRYLNNEHDRWNKED
jgi:hypothetical protein